MSDEPVDRLLESEVTGLMAFNFPSKERKCEVTLIRSSIKRAALTHYISDVVPTLTILRTSSFDPYEGLVILLALPWFCR